MTIIFIIIIINISVILAANIIISTVMVCYGYGYYEALHQSHSHATLLCLLTFNVVTDSVHCFPPFAKFDQQTQVVFVTAALVSGATVVQIMQA